MNAVDFYQLFCFLMQVPAEDHDGEWGNIESMMTLSSATSLTPFVTLWAVPLLAIYQLF